MSAPSGLLSQGIMLSVGPDAGCAPAWPYVGPARRGRRRAARWRLRALQDGLATCGVIGERVRDKLRDRYEEALMAHPGRFRIPCIHPQ
jgi:hypothetical protein